MGIHYLKNEHIKLRVFFDDGQLRIFYWVIYLIIIMD